MDDTGRIKSVILPAARNVLFEGDLERQINEELRYICQVDRAHLVMLAEVGIIDRSLAATLLRAIDRLVASHFAPLQARQASRGLYLLYEDYLIETEGASIGGMLQIARSRNDLNATTLKLRLRRHYLAFAREALRLQAVLLRNSKKFSNIVMPIYTHGQAAMPGSLGHYLAGVAQSLGRDLDTFIYSAKWLHISPLGAGAVGGTTLPIDTQRTASLLGFECGPLNSIDAVASRNVVLQMLSAALIYGVTLSRLANDFLQWAGAEFNFLRLPDEIVGSSSAMPQKRNPFLLEHVLGRATTAIGAFISAITATRATSFTNSVMVGTESIRQTWQAFDDMSNSILLMRLVLSRATPNPEAMLRRATAGLTTAVYLATRIATINELDFRTAHRLVGDAIHAVAQSESVLSMDNIILRLKQSGLTVPHESYGAQDVVDISEYGGGPGARSMETCLLALKQQWRAHRSHVHQQSLRWCEGDKQLDLAARAVCATEPNGRRISIGRNQKND